MSILEIRKALHAARTPWYAKHHQGSGFYGLYLKCDHTMDAIDVPLDGLLYIGMTNAGFSHRDHFYPKSRHSGYCTARRSIGALMRERLKLLPRPRSNRADAMQSNHFRFDPRSEARLSDWMAGAIHVARVPFDGNVEAAENLLITHLTPPLNLTGWANPQAGFIKAQRHACALAAFEYAQQKMVA